MHYDLVGQHAFLGASKFHWINYSDEKLDESYLKHLAAEKGTELHAFASDCIRLGRKLKGKDTLAMYVNDAIGHGMTPEQVLYYSENCFGTADSIIFRKNFLRIHDLKTGVTPTHIEQVEVYAALFCMEYDVKPEGIGIELRIYQNDEIFTENPDPEKIHYIMDKIVRFDKRIKEIQLRE